MKNTDYKNDNIDNRVEADAGVNNGSNVGRKHHAGRIIAIVAGGLALLIVLLLIGVTLYLSPNRLKSIIEDEGSRYLAADVRVGKVDYTFWSSFPNLRVSVDSIEVTSRTLDVLSKEAVVRLPEGSNRLLSVMRVSGGIDLWKAIRNDIRLKDIEIIRPTCNLVMVNDSVNNFMIFPKLGKDVKIPHVALNTVKIGAPVKVSFYDAASNVRCNADIDDALFKIIEGKQDKYALNMSGDVSFASDEISTVKSLPLVVSSDVGLGFSPLTVTVEDCNVHIADINLRTDASLIASKHPAVGRFDLDFSCDDIMGVSQYFSFPEESKLKDIAGELPLYAKLRLESPYEIPRKGGGELCIPAFTLSVNVPGGKLAYPIDNQHKLNLRRIALQADLNVDPENPDAAILLVPMAKAYTDGASVDASATVRELMSGDPLLDARVQCKADIGSVLGKFLTENGIKASGVVNGMTNLTCRLGELSRKKVKDLNVKGDFKVNALHLSDRAEKLVAAVRDLSLKLRASVPSLSSSGLGDSRLNLIASSGAGKVKSGADTVNFGYKNLSLSGNIGARGIMSNPTLGGNINLTAGNLTAEGDKIKLNLNGTGLKLKAAMRHVPWSSSQNYSVIPASEGDSIIEHRVRHTPIFLVATVPAMLQTGLSLLNMDADLRINEGTLLADGYPVRNEFRDVNISTNLDTLVIKSLGIATRGATAQLKGKVGGLRNFLMSSTPAALTADIDANFTDVDINRLSGNYYAGQAKITGTPADYVVPSPGTYTAADSLCVLIPRNLIADIRLHSDRAEYMGWQFSPLSTDITLHDGVAKIGDLRIGADYGGVDVDWTYSTADLQDIFMALDVDVNDFDVSGFFKAFPMVTASMPEIENLSGKVSAKIDGKLLMFPDMFVNAPSMTADVNVHTSGVAFKRDDTKIRRITNLMLLKGDAPLKINDLDIHASFHDNLLQLDPFDVDCGPYKVGVAGVNNLQGEMYYHLGLHGSPLHIPFGVNLVGDWRHPKVRLGGANIHDGREREISANLKDDVNVNIMRELKHGWLLFIAAAAKYDAENNQTYVFYVE